ncbi:MAG: hypothetical protein IJS19_00340 [Muribaculaceae bacterium]|nr:hypothetical protein [Muribaculaceae bacterium]
MEKEKEKILAEIYWDIRETCERFSYIITESESHDWGDITCPNALEWEDYQITFVFDKCYGRDDACLWVDVYVPDSIEFYDKNGEQIQLTEEEKEYFLDFEIESEPYYYDEY